MADVRRFALTTSARRAADQRQFQIFFWVGFLLFLPVVAIRRLLPSSWHGPRFGALRHHTSVVEETTEEVRNVLAFVFMA
jgi:hypothetical protein